MRSPAIHCLLAVVLAASLACGSDDGVKPGPPPGPPVWSEITNIPSSVTLYSIWAPRDDLAIGVGRAGHIWQWSGQRWTQLNPTTAEDLFAIDGSTTGSVVAVGNHGTVLEQSQGSFTPVDANTVEDLRGVWRSDTGMIVAVGGNGLVIRRVGNQWSEDPSPNYASLLGVWGSGDNDIFAVGVGGVITHDDGSGWSIMPSGTTQLLSAISGNSPVDVYAVGAAGTVLHYDGTSWSPMQSGTTGLLQSVCAGCGPAAAGTNGLVLRMVNNAWKRETLDGSPWLYAIRNSTNAQWAAGSHALFRHDGTAWASQNRGTVPILRSIAYSAGTGLVAAGENGGVLIGGPRHWRYEDAGALSRLNAVWVSPSGDVFAAGINRIFRRTDDGWVTENSQVVEYFGLGGNETQVFAAGADGVIRERRGSIWASVLTTTYEDLHAVRMTETGGFIVGTGGVILELTGGNWGVKHTRANTVLWDIATVQSANWSAVAVGENGVSLGRSTAVGVGWSVITTPVSHALYCLVRAPGGDLLAVGATGTVLRFDDGQWNIVPVSESRTYRSACATNDAIFVCGGTTGSGGIILRYGPPN
jgi:hypothetical protein